MFMLLFHGHSIVSQYTSVMSEYWKHERPLSVFVERDNEIITSQQ